MKNELKIFLIIFINLFERYYNYNQSRLVIESTLYSRYTQIYYPKRDIDIHLGSNK
jgi:hypothetical protein